MRRATHLVALVVVIVLAQFRPALAGTSAGQNSNPDGSSKEIVVYVGDSSAGGSGGGASKGVPVTEADRARWREMELRRRTSHPLFISCMDNLNNQAVCLANFDGNPSQDDVSSTAALVREAVSRLSITHPGIEMSPPVGKSAWVQLSVWLWVPQESWVDQHATAVSLDGTLEVQVLAYPIQARWNMGDGTEVVCDGPGKTYNYGLDEEEQSSDCSHVYDATSAGQPGEA